MNRDVYLIEYDLISALGVGKEEVFNSLKSNHLPADYIKGFDTSGLKYNVAAEISSSLEPFYKDEDERIKQAIMYDRKFEIIFSCYKMMQTRLENIFSQVDSKRAGVSIGMGIDINPIEKMRDRLNSFEGTPLYAYFNAAKEMNIAPGTINSIFNPLDLSSVFLASKLNLQAYQRTLLTSCAASTQGIVEAFSSIRHGEADIVLTGGGDSIVNLMAVAGFGKLQIIAGKGDDIKKRCRPFDKSRNGTLVGEGGGLMVLACEEIVKKLGVTPIARFASYGNTLDGYKITSPDPQGRGMKRAMRSCYQGLDPEKVDYINLHGTGTMANDSIELESFRNVYGERAPEIAVSSTKSRHGHSIAAAGVLELSIVALCMEKSFIPQNMNLETPIDDQLDLIRTGNREQKIRVGVSNNFAFGGVNTVISLENMGV